VAAPGYGVRQWIARVYGLPARPRDEGGDPGIVHLANSTLTNNNPTVPKAGLATNLLLWIVRSHGGYGYCKDSVQTAAPESAFR
jgi:hypothetical protein